MGEDEAWRATATLAIAASQRTLRSRRGPVASPLRFFWKSLKVCESCNKGQWGDGLKRTRMARLHTSGWPNHTGAAVEDGNALTNQLTAIALPFLMNRPLGLFCSSPACNGAWDLSVSWFILIYNNGRAEIIMKLEARGRARRGSWALSEHITEAESCLRFQ